MTECLFCKIIRKELPADILYEDEEIVVFKDKFPKAPVHVLLVPKKHIEGVATLEAADAPLVGKLVIRARFIAEELGLIPKRGPARLNFAQQNLGGYKLIFNVGKDGGQVIGHLHLHLLGGKPLGGPV